MSLDPEAVQEELGVAVGLPVIQLSLGTSQHGGWDDRELINVYDTALEEFHLLNPGPGSWLDKATAAQLVGKPLPGAAARSSPWYNSSLPTPPAESSSPSNLKRARTSKHRQASTSNPYTSQADDKGVHPRRNYQQSPTYAPPSPPIHKPQGPQFVAAEDYDGAAWSPSAPSAVIPIPDTEAALPHQQQTLSEDVDTPGLKRSSPSSLARGLFPAPSCQWDIGFEDVTPDAALSYAMHAQYWAGYWMGVSRSTSFHQTGHPGSHPEDRTVTTYPQSGTLKANNGLKR